MVNDTTGSSVNRQKPPKELDKIEGEVLQYYPPSQNDEEIWRPAKLVILTSDGEEVDLSEWPKKDFDTKETMIPIRLPRFDRLDVGNIIGLMVKAVAMENGPYNDRKQYLVTKDGKITVSGGEDKPPQAAQAPEAAPAVQQQQPAAKPTASSSWTTSIDLRIAWNSAVNNAVAALGNPTDDEEYWIKVVWYASNIYKFILAGPPPEEEPEEQAEPVLSEDDILGKL